MKERVKYAIEVIETENTFEGPRRIFQSYIQLVCGQVRVGRANHRDTVQLEWKAENSRFGHNECSKVSAKSAAKKKHAIVVHFWHFVSFAKCGMCVVESL